MLEWWGQKIRRFSGRDGLLGPVWLVSETRNGEDCQEEHSTQRVPHVRMNFGEMFSNQNEQFWEFVYLRKSEDL